MIDPKDSFMVGIIILILFPILIVLTLMSTPDSKCNCIHNHYTELKEGK